MAQYLISDTYMTNIANAIRGKLNSSDTYLPSQMAGAINSILTPVGSQTITENGSYNITDKATVIVNVPWDWRGAEPELLYDNYYSNSFTLASTTFPSWEPSTTAKSIKSAVTIDNF